MSDQPIQSPMAQQIAQMASAAAPPIPPGPVINRDPVNPEGFRPPAVAVDNDLALQFTQTVRTQVAQNLMADGALTGHDTKQTNLMLQVLRDMDSQAISAKRIKADEKSAGALSDASALVNRVLDSVNPTQFGVHRGVAPVDVQARELKNDETIRAVPGEMDVNPGQLNYKDFVGKMRGGNEPPKT